MRQTSGRDVSNNLGPLQNGFQLFVGFSGKMKNTHAAEITDFSPIANKYLSPAPRV